MQPLDLVPPLLLAAPLALGFLAWRRLSRRAFAALVAGCALALLGGELWLRALGVAHPVRAEWNEPRQALDAVTPAYQPSGELLYRYPSDPRGYFGPGGLVRGTINALGYRGSERARVKPTGVFRVAVLGDSFTSGIGVRDEDTLPARLEAQLRGVEVLNFGVSASDTLEQVRYLEGYVSAFEPDLFLIVFFLNDAERAATMEFLTRPRVLVGLREHSFLLNGSLGVLERVLSRGEMRQHYLSGYAPDAPGWVRAREALREARDHCARRGARLALAVHPILVDLDDYPFAQIHAAVLDFCAAEGIPAVDLLPAFAGRDARELWVHENDQHPNELAHALSAAVLADFLILQGLVPR